ncbi:glycerophosphodiester phosphodiesterase domain-containing protein 3 [Crotalus adamanteus]|uniref:Glycerophosphodiester phosphodiesterase domain-containing protein 3 n=1 Tax=Crotalus adamanteus TaxID=8729 RepID=A0AAW1B6L4_CROAD
MSCNMLLFGLPALGIYALVSHCLRKKPHLLHKPHRFPVRCLHVSHRGGAGEQIENTLGAFKNALSQGTNLLELDCHITKDGIVVVSHDENLKRQTGHNIDISLTYYKDLPHYQSSLEVTFSPGRFSSGTDHQIPRLEEVFEQFPSVPINIEIKEDNDELINKVAHLVQTYHRSHITIWASIHDGTLKKCRKANKDMPYIFSKKRVIVMLCLWYLGLLPFYPLKESFFEFVLPSIINRTYFPVKKGRLGSLLAKLTTKVAMHKQLLKHLEDRGIQVLLWVLNEEKDFEEAFSYGVSGIMTDYPTLLRHYLNAHPPPPSLA